MEPFVAVLKEFGPFTLPICIVMAWAIRWLLQDRQRLLDELKDARKDATDVREKRMEDQRSAAKEFREYGDAIAHRLEDFNKRVDKAFDKE